jgi:hypothetical protein
MKTFAIIPTQLAAPLTLDKLLSGLSFDNVNRIFILDNRKDNTPLIRQHSYISTQKEEWLNSYGLTIYEMWNTMWQSLKESYPGEELNIAFLNDDIEIKSGSLGVLSYFLRRDNILAAICPDYDSPWHDRPYGMYNPEFDHSVVYTNSTFGDNGMAGFCFMIKGELDIPYVDENLKLYWGDDDLVKSILKMDYKIGKLVGMPVSHVGSMTIRQMNPAERVNIMEKDRAYFNKKYNENREPVW